LGSSLGESDSCYLGLNCWSYTNLVQRGRLHAQAIPEHYHPVLRALMHPEDRNFGRLWSAQTCSGVGLVFASMELSLQEFCLVRDISLEGVFSLKGFELGGFKLGRKI